MFGLSTFAQTPFAALGGGNQYALSITEAFTSSDSNTQQFAFLQSITEPVTMTDNNSEAAIYIFAETENFGVADSNTQQFAFLDLSLIHISEPTRPY